MPQRERKREQGGRWRGRRVCQASATHRSIDNNSGRKSRASGKISNARARARARERVRESATGLKTAALIGATGKAKGGGGVDGGGERRSSEDEWERSRAYTCEGIVEIPWFSSMRARNERENKGKKGANYWSTWRKTKDCAGARRRDGGNDRKADSCGETERTKITTKRG